MSAVSTSYQYAFCSQLSPTQILHHGTDAGVSCRLQRERERERERERDRERERERERGGGIMWALAKSLSVKIQ